MSGMNGVMEARISVSPSIKMDWITSAASHRGKNSGDTAVDVVNRMTKTTALMTSCTKSDARMVLITSVSSGNTICLTRLMFARMSGQARAINSEITTHGIKADRRYTSN